MTIKQLKEKQLIGTTERIVIEYANLSGRETANRAEFRNRVQKIVSGIQNELIEAVCEEIGKNINISEFDKIFREFYDDNEAGGSSRWLVAPTNVQIIVRGYFKRIEDKIKEIKK